MKTIELECKLCKKFFTKQRKEFDRVVKTGRVDFFCSIKCSAISSNSKFKLKTSIMTEPCAYCKKPFSVEVALGKEDMRKQHCSISCASKNSVNERRIQASRLWGQKNKNFLNSPENTLKSRENWKYRLIERILVRKKIPHEFEFRIKGYIYDLALVSDKILIEFDGPYHKYNNLSDRQKDLVAKECGWELIRIEVAPAELITISMIKPQMERLRGLEHS